MNFVKKCLVAVAMLCIHFTAFSQDSLVNKPDSLSLEKASLGKQTNNINPGACNFKTQLAPKTYLILLSSDIKQEFTKPFHTNKKEWAHFGVFAGGIALLFVADKPIQKAALKLRNRNTAINGVSHYITNFGGIYEGYTLAGLAGYGLVFKNKKMVTTTLLATQAYITGAAAVTVVKFLTGETRPSYYGPGEVASPRFLGLFQKAGNIQMKKALVALFLQDTLPLLLP